MKQGMNRLTHRARLIAAALLCVVAAMACTPPNQLEKSRGEAFKQYETIIRWSQWDAAVDFISPEYLADNPVSQLDMDRLRLFRVTSYTLRSAGVFDEGMTARQVVEIKMFNKRQSVERTIIDEQEWRYNDLTKRWQLHSGLPDPTKRY